MKESKKRPKLKESNHNKFGKEHNGKCREANCMNCHLNVYVLFAWILDKEGKSFFPLWTDGCVTSLKLRKNRNGD